MDDYLDVEIDVFEYSAQHARLRRGITIATLIHEILKQFDDIAADSPEKYAIYLKGVDRPLNSTYTLEQLDIQPHDRLVFDYVRQPIRQMLQPSDYAFLREENTGKVFDIQWQPAVIGRPDADVGHNIILAVNVQLLPNGMTVSRNHAQITFTEGHYYVEPCAEHNPVFLNSKEIPLNSKRELKNNDKLAIGRNKVTMVFETQRAAAPRAAEPKSQAARKVSPPPPSPAPAPTTTVPAPAAAPVASEPADRNATVLSTGDNPLSFLIVEKSSSAETRGQKLTLIEYPFLLGRTLPLLSGEKETSRKHAEVTYDAHQKKYYITDLKSTNGVTVDGAPIRPEEPTEIKPGTRIGLGQVLVLRFEV
jgi:pSer/pThr/pTyr-binding forkhead associated (FHA) protein